LLLKLSIAKLHLMNTGRFTGYVSFDAINWLNQMLDRDGLA
jgi:hypothetical protein